MWFSQKSIFKIIMAFEYLIDSKLWVGRNKELLSNKKDKKAGISVTFSF